MIINETKRKLALLTALASATMLSGCTLGPDFKRPDWASPASWFAGPKEAVKPARSTPAAEPIDAAWWSLFKDPILTGLEKRVAAENLDVKTAAIRMAESRAQLGVARAALFPTLNGNASYTRELASENGVFGLIPAAAGANGANGATGNSTGGIQGTGLKPFDLYQGGFDFDVGGRPVGRRSAFRRIGLRHLRRSQRDRALGAPVQLGRGRPRLYATSRHAGAA